MEPLTDGALGNPDDADAKRPTRDSADGAFAQPNWSQRQCCFRSRRPGSATTWKRAVHTQRSRATRIEPNGRSAAKRQVIGVTVDIMLALR
jgi:hypothetical protein